MTKRPLQLKTLYQHPSEPIDISIIYITIIINP